MKIHPALFVLLVLCALAGAFAVGRLGQQSPVAASVAPAAVTNVPAQVVTNVPSQSAEIKTARETLRVEGSATILPAPTISK